MENKVKENSQNKQNKVKIEILINNKEYREYISPDLMLVDLLRQLGFLSVKKSCNTSNCGLCTVWLNNKPVLSCSVPALRVAGQAITTLEGAGKEAEIFAAFLMAEGAEQCGYCSPGLIMAVLAMKRDLQHPSEGEINNYLAGNLCRCSGYVGQLRAIEKYLEVESV